MLLNGRLLGKVVQNVGKMRVIAPNVCDKTLMKSEHSKWVILTESRPANVMRLQPKNQNMIVEDTLLEHARHQSHNLFFR